MGTSIDGYKTYLVCAATVIYAVTGMIIGQLEPNMAIPLIFGALGGASLRHSK